MRLFLFRLLSLRFSSFLAPSYVAKTVERSYRGRSRERRKKQTRSCTRGKRTNALLTSIPRAVGEKEK